MNDFDTLYAAAALPVMQQFFGESATYTHGATVTVLTAELTPIETVEQDRGDGNTVYVKRRFATVSKTAVPTPSRKATMTIDSEIWAVKRVELDSDSIVILELVLSTAMEVAPPGFRRQ
jgi:hypothetical protein